MKCGIYGIINIVNKKCYVGSSYKIEARIIKHYSELNLNRHENTYLQYAWNKYGKENFINIIFEESTKEELIIKEQLWIESLQTYDRNKGYNLRRIANSNIGIKFSKESASKCGQYERTPEIIEKIKSKLIGRKLPIEQVEKTRLANKERILKPRRWDLWPHQGGIQCKCRKCRDVVNERSHKYKLTYRSKLKAAREVTYYG